MSLLWLCRGRWRGWILQRLPANAAKGGRNAHRRSTVRAVDSRRLIQDALLSATGISILLCRRRQYTASCGCRNRLLHSLQSQKAGRPAEPLATPDAPQPVSFLRLPDHDQVRIALIPDRPLPSRQPIIAAASPEIERALGEPRSCIPSRGNAD